MTSPAELEFEQLFLEDAEGVLDWLKGIGSGAAAGAATGAAGGPWGALIGGLVGAGLGAAQTAQQQRRPPPSRAPRRPAPRPGPARPVTHQPPRPPPVARPAPSAQQLTSLLATLQQLIVALAARERRSSEVESREGEPAGTPRTALHVEQLAAEDIVAGITFESLLRNSPLDEVLAESLLEGEDAPDGWSEADPFATQGVLDWREHENPLDGVACAASPSHQEAWAPDAGEVEALVACDPRPVLAGETHPDPAATTESTTAGDQP